MKTLYHCSYCGFSSTESSETLLHEGECRWNKAKRQCCTCEHKIHRRDDSIRVDSWGGVFGCKKEVEVSSLIKLISTPCEYWEEANGG